MAVNMQLSRASRSSKGLQEEPSPIMSCFVCDQSLYSSNDFDIHLEKHSNEKPSRCLMCSKVFRFRGSLTRHLFTEHGILEKLKSDVLGSESDFNLKRFNEKIIIKEEKESEDDDDEDGGVSRIMEGFLPNQSKKSKKHEEPNLEKLNNGDDKTGLARLTPESEQSELLQTKTKVTDLVQCDVCKVLFTTANSLQIHRKLNHAMEVDSCSLPLKPHVINGDQNGGVRRARKDSYKVRRVDIGGPSENIVTEPDFELIKIAAAGIHLNYDISPAVSPTSKDNSRVIEWNSGVFSVGHFVDEDDDQEESPCVEPVNDSGTNVKYRLCPSSEEVLVTRVVGVNVGNGERAFLYKCHWCSEVFLSLDKLREHLGSHLRRSRKTFTCYNCGQLFSTNSCLKLHLPQCEKDEDDIEDEVEDETVVKSSESLSPLDFTSTSSEGGIPLSDVGCGAGDGSVGCVPPNDIKIKSEPPDLENPEDVCVPSCDVQIKVEPLDDSYENVDASKSYSSYEAAVEPPPKSFLNFEPESVMKFNALTVKTESEPIETSVVEKKQPPAVSPAQNNNSPPTLLMTKDGTRVGYQCNYCPKLFDRLYSLNRHLRSHTGVKPCYCKECGKGFSEPRNLRHHIIRFHSDGSERHLLRRVRDRNSKGGGKPKRGNAPPVVVNLPLQSGSKSMGLMLNATGSQLSTDDVANNCDNRKGKTTGWTLFDPESLTAKLFEARPDKRRKLEDVISGGNNGIALLYPTGVTSDTPPKRNCGAKSNLEETTECTFQILSDPKLSLLGNLRMQRQNRNTTASNSNNKAKFSNDVDLSPHLSALSSLSGAVVNRVMDSIVGGNTMNSNKDVQLDEFLKNNAEKLNLLSVESGGRDGDLRNNAADELRTRTDFCKVEILPNDIHLYKCIFCNYSSGTKCNLKVHVMRHRGIKNYNCGICNFWSVTRSDLNRHSKTMGHRLRTRFLRQSS